MARINNVRKVRLVAIAVLLAVALPLIYKAFQTRTGIFSWASGTVTAEGYVIAATVDDFERQKSSVVYSLIDAKGKVIPFKYAGEQRINTGSYVKISGTIDQSSQVIDSTTSSSGEVLVVSPASSLPSKTVNDKKVAVIILNYATSVYFYTPLGPNVASEMREFFRTTMYDYFRENSYGKLNLNTDVFGVYQFGNASCDQATTFLTGVAAADANNIDLAGYDELIIVTPKINSLNSYTCDEANGYASTGKISVQSKYGVKTLGISRVNGNLWPNNRQFAHVTAHELGHNMGSWSHANALECGLVPYLSNTDCVVRESWDYWDTMGASYRFPHFNGFHKLLFGWLSASDVVTLYSGGDYSLAPLESPASSLPRLAVIPKGNGEAYYVENRQPIGYDNVISQSTNMLNGAFVYIAPMVVGPESTKVIDYTPNRDTLPEGNPEDFKDPALEVGKTYNDAVNQFQISTVGKSVNGNLTLRFTPNISTNAISMVFPPNNYEYYKDDPAIEFTWLPVSGNQPVKYQLVLDPKDGVSKPFYPGYFRCPELCTDVNCAKCFSEILKDPFTLSNNSSTDKQIYWQVNAKDNLGNLFTSSLNRIYVKASTRPSPTPTGFVLPTPTLVPLISPATTQPPAATIVPTQAPTSTPTLIKYSPTPTSSLGMYQCKTDCDCVCGKNSSGKCEFLNRAYSSGACTIPNFCSGINGKGSVACVLGKCVFKSTYTYNCALTR